MKLPFKLNPSAKGSYTEQLTESLREAIRSGCLRPGDRLPSWDEMAAELGVSRRIPRAALTILGKEGYVISRPRIGTVVGRSADRRSWKAPILYVRYEVDAASYCSNTCLEVFRRRMLEEGYPTMPLEIPRKKRGGLDFPLIEGVRHFRHSLVVNNCSYHPEIDEWCAGLGAPVLAATDGKVYQEREFEMALYDFADHCRRKGIRRIMEVTFASPTTIRLPSSFARAGIKVEGWMIPPVKDRPRPESVRTAAEQAFAHRLAEGQGWLPDLFFFTDDYLAEGALLAMALNGVRIPQEVKVVTLANAGNVPVWDGSCATLLYRQSVRGERLAAAALDILMPGSTHKPQSRVPMVEYIPGDTFPA